MKNKKNQLLWSIPLISAVLSPVSMAVSLENISITGFGTVAGGITDDDQTSGNSPYEDSINFTPDSLMAIQLRADLGEGLSATAQVLSRGADEFNADFSWAYLAYEVNDSLTVRAGRIRTPFYAYSDYVDVGFALPFLNAPKSVYIGAVDEMNGVNLLYSRSFGGFDFSANVAVGDVEEEVTGVRLTAASDVNDLIATRFEISKDWLKLSFLYLQSRFHFDHESLQTVADGLVAAGASPTAASKLLADGDRTEYYSVALQVDHENFFLTAEASTYTIPDTFVLDSDQWYVMAGYRFDSIAPYVIYESKENDRDSDIPGEFPVALQPSVDALLLAGVNDFKGISAGMRWDFHSNAAFKIEYNHYHDVVDYGSAFGNDVNKETLNVLTIAADFVF